MNKKGYSLIEVVIGLAILAVAILGIMGMQIASVRGNAFSRYMTQATYAAQDGLEMLDRLPLTNSALDPANSPFNDPPVDIAGIVFNRSYTVATDANNNRIINYTVTWNDGVNRRITLSTRR